MAEHDLPKPLGYSTAVGEIGFHKINVRGYQLSEIIENLTFSQAVFLTIRGELPSKAQTKVMDALLCAILEHGLFTPTTLAARVIASAAPQSIVAGVAGSLLTVGSVTVSPQDTGELIEYTCKLMENSSLSKEEAAREVVKEMVSRKERMPGVGHPLHPTGDPRAVSLKKVAIENGVWGAKAELFEVIRDEFTKVIGKSLPINVDGMMGCLLTELGFSPKIMPGVAAMSFMPGIIAHAAEEISEGIKLRTADVTYTGATQRELPQEYKTSSK